MTMKPENFSPFKNTDLQVSFLFSFFFFWSNSILEVVLVTQPCLTLCDPMACSPPGSSVHGILQAGRLQWVAISFSSITC